MPIYKYEGKKYNIPEDKVAEFERAFPNAVVVMYAGDKTYNIPVGKQQAFKTSFDDASYNPIQAAADVEGVKTTESGSVVVSPAEAKENTDSINQFLENRDTLYAGLQDYDTGIVSGAEQRRRDDAAAEAEAQAEAMRQRLQEDGTIDRMKGAKKETRREKLSAFGRMLGSTPQVTSFGVSTNVFDSTDEQLADVGQALDAGTEYRQNKLLQEKLDVALDMARAGENQDGLRGVENFGLGLWDSATRLSTWDFGASDIVNNLTLQQIVEKWENDPSSLTATEQKVLEGIGMATAVQELYSDQVGIGYNVGQSLPESAGFMASMALNPASGLGKSLARNAVRTYGRNSIAKNLARIGGDIAETAIMTATTGAGRVAADALERINGSSTYEIGDNGVIMYGGQKDQETVGDAVLKAIGSSFIENYSEALGEYFDPLLGMSRKVAAGGLRKINLNKWADALSDVQPSQMTASIRSLREKTKFGGIFGEIMEEEIGMALNTLFVGDNQWSDFVDLETQLTTVLSCAIMSGTLNGVEQVSSVAARRKMEKNAKNAEQDASYRFSSDKFAPLREAIDQASPEGMVDVLRDVYMSQEYTVGQKRALAEYAAARLQLQYYNAADAKARRQVNKTQQELLDAQEAGLNAQLPQFFNIARAAQSAEDDLVDYDGDWNLVDIIRSSMNRPEEMERILGDLPPREAQLVTNYIYSRARMEGAYQGRSNRAEDYIDDFAYTLEPAVVTDAEGNRTITTALLGDRSVYVLDNNGDLAHIMRPDGSKTLVKASELTNITTSSADEVIDRYRDMYTSEYNAETENAFEHHPKTQAPQVGLQLQSPEGEAVITAINDNMVEIVPAVYKDGQVQPKEGAEPKTITVDDAYAWQDDYYLSMDADQAYASAMAEASNMSAETAENEGVPTEQIEQSVSEEVTDGQNAETVSQPTKTESVAPAAPQTARERVPKDEEGNPIYEQADADTAWDAIVEETDGDTEMAQRVAADMLEDKKASLAKIQKGKPKKGATVAEKIANEKAHQAAIAKAQNDIAQWEAIVGTEARRREAAMSEADRYAAEMEQKNISEGLKALGEPQSLEEYVLAQLAGDSYKLRWSDKENGTKGFGSHTGLSTEEMKARLSMIDNKNGLTPEEIAHSIVENMDASFGEVDVMDVTNMVIDAVSTHASRRSMLNGMVESRAELIRQQEIAEQEAKDAWYMEQYHATEEELAAYSEYLAEITEEIIADDANYEERFNTFAELIADEYDNQGTDADIRSSADQGEGLASDREGSSSVGEGEETDRQGAVLGDAPRFAEAEDGRAGSSVSAESDVDVEAEEWAEATIQRIRELEDEIANIEDVISEFEAGERSYIVDAEIAVLEDRLKDAIVERDGLLSLAEESNEGADFESRQKKGTPAGVRVFDGKSKRVSEEYARRTGWTEGLNDIQLEIVDHLRGLTDEELKDFRRQVAEAISRDEDAEHNKYVLDTVDKYRRSGEREHVKRESGILPRQDVSLDKIEELFMEYNRDENLAILFDRLRPLIEKINPRFIFDIIRDADGNVADKVMGDYSLKDNLIRINYHSLYSGYQTDQEKASTIVHEMIHAITQYAIDANERGDKTLPKNVLEAAKSLVNIYNQIKDSEIFNTTQVDEEGNVIRDYGVKDVHEMISELANPEFREKLKQIDVKGKNAWERIIDTIARFINQFKDIYDTTAYGKAVRALDTLMDNFNLDAYERSRALGSEAKESRVDNLRFREKEEPKDGKSLVGLHNISEEKLKKALKMGGLANPSMAVIDVDKQGHTEFGDITLVAPSTLIDKKSGRNAGTYLGDAWTPTYPTVKLKLSDEAWKKINSYIDSVEENPALRSEMRYGIEQSLTYGSGYSNMQRVFLKEKGIDIPVEYKKVEGYVTLDEINELLGFEIEDGSIEEYKKFEQLPESTKYEAIIWSREKGNKKRIGRYKREQEKENEQNPEMEELHMKLILNHSGFSDFNTLVYDALRRKEEEGKVDTQRTMSNASNYVALNGLSEEFDQWLTNKLEDAGAKEMLFAGYTNTGNARYIPNTLENASKLMKKEGKANSGNNTGYGATRATLVENADSLQKIRKSKGKLSNKNEEAEALYQENKDMLWELIEGLLSHRVTDTNQFFAVDNANKVLNEAFRSKNPLAYLKSEGYDVSEEFAEKLNAFIRSTKELPVGYFETKFERPVYLNEFAAAVVPTGTSQEVVDALKQSGLEVVEYEQGNEEARTEALRNITNEIENIRFRDGAPFFSNAERAVENIKQQKATPEQWLAMIKKDGGLKAGEDKWMGLSDWLNEQKTQGVKTLTKDEVLAFIRENQIEIEEVEYEERLNEDVLTQEQEERFESLKTEFYDIQEENEWDVNTAFNEMISRYGDDFDMGFYPNAIGELSFQDDIHGMPTFYAQKILGKNRIRLAHSTRLNYTTEGLDNKKEIALVVPTIEPWNQSDKIHFGDAGDGRAVAWVRFGETTDEDGNRVLVIDEVQSKRHDEGRSKGYKSNARLKELEREYDALIGKQVELTKEILHDAGYAHKSESEGVYNETMQLKAETGLIGTDEQRARYNDLSNKLYEVSSEQRKLRNAIPDAPFDKNYHELVMKRMLRYAAENGFDKVAWTKGAQQAQRYGLSNTVSSIEYKPLSNGHYSVTAYGTNGYPIGNIPAVYNSEQEIADVFGKEMAVKIAKGSEEAKQNLAEHVEARKAVRSKMEEVAEDSAEYDTLLEEYAKHDNAIMEANSVRIIEGEDLQIGGDGMKGYYDEMIPRFMNKYTKKWGTKVGEVTLPNVEKAGRTMWSVDVTPEMKESVMQGQPMFREGMGAISDREVSYENDPIAKFQGKPRYYGKRAAAFAERERRRMENAAKEAAEMLGIEAEIVTDASTLQGRKAKAKGWYDIVNKKVVVVVPNHVSMGDAVRTVLHEGVAHHGLRELFGDGFDAMLDNVYNNVAPELKARIDAIAERTGVSTSVATEEYLASLAEETNFEEAQRRGWWEKIKQYFVKMLDKLGMPELNLKEELTDNELRYLLWRSYKNLVEPNSYAKPLGYAEDVVKQKELKVGQYAENTMEARMAAEPNSEYTSEEQEIIAKAKEDDTYMKAPNGEPTNLTPEQWVRVRTKSFIRWFGDWLNDPQNASKVVDENGEPRVVYHGTPWYGFNIFVSGNGEGSPIYFAQNRAFAQSFADKHKGEEAEFEAEGSPLNPNVYEVFLNVKNPVNLGSLGEMGENAYNRIKNTLGLTDEQMSRYAGRKEYTVGFELLDFDKDFNKLIRSLGYDGVLGFENGTDYGNQIAVYAPSQIKSATENNGEYSDENDDIRYRTSEEIEAEYPNWMEGTTTDSGKHSTQVEGTRKTYNKVGDWIEENIGKDVAILDASSGMGYGTADLRERGFNIEDVEPYQSEERKKNNPATYSSYADIDKKYDFIISNAVLNVIPDDWRRDVLHNMAERMNDGGKLFINTRKAGEEKAIKDKIDLDTPQEVLVKRNGKIASYQKFFTPQELKAWVESELGDGYVVEVASKKNSGTSGLAAVMVTKKADGLRYREGDDTRFMDALADAYASGDKKAIQNAVNDIIDAMRLEDADPSIGNLDWEKVEDYEGSNPRLLAAQYIVRAKHHLYLDEDYDTEYIKTGIKTVDAPINEVAEGDVNRYTNDFKNERTEAQRQFEKQVEESQKSHTKGTWLWNGLMSAEDIRERHQKMLEEFDGLLSEYQFDKAAEKLGEIRAWQNAAKKYIDAPYNEIPYVGEEVLIAEIERESAALGVPVRIARSVDELPDEDTRKRAVDGKLKGYYDPRTNEVVLYAPNTDDANDAKRTILHEIVGHKGLRQLIGEHRYDKAMVQLTYMLPADVRDAVLRRAERHGWNAAIAMDEYLAEQAERDVQPTWWGKVNAKIRAILRNMGFNVMLTDADVTYLLWRSRKKLQGDTAFDMATDAILKQAARKSAEADAWNEQAFKDMEMRDFERNALPSIRHRMGADTNDYEKAMRTLGFKQSEAWQDSMRSLHVFQAAIAKASGKDITDFENAYMYENRMSSANLMEMEQYRHMVYNPLLKEIHELEQMGASRESIINYLFAKSGLERNEVFARRDAKKHAEGDAAKEQQLYDRYRQKDYAGLTALTRGDAQIAALVDDHSKKKTEYDRLEQNKKRGVAVSDADLKAAKIEMDDARKAMITAIEAEAQRMVDEFERAHNTDNLLDKIRNCTHTTLNISHDAGVMSDEVYNELWNQFQYYIPLRGFAETTAEDVYLYLGGSDSPYNAPIKTAYGRTSLADDPIATIGNMAESAIVEANRNRLKQRFLYMVERHNTDLASISDVWLEYDEVNDEWHTVFAQIPDDATPSEAKRLQQEFEDRMKLLAEQNPGKYANASQQPNIPYRVVKKGDRQEHHVIVKRNGKDVVITINGNPRVAQAINGLTNPEQNQGMVSRMASWVNRNLSANFTMRNPAFMVSNFVRDGFYTNSMVWVKENPAYAWQYNQNWMKCTAQIASLVSRYKRYEKGDTSALDMNNDMDRMFYEFMINGGETGYTVIKSVEDYKGLLSGEMKKMEAGAMGTARRVADTIGNVVDTFGRWAEDTSRFAAYMTSRQLGRTITKSIWDAKEISVNFNKKGSGNRMMGKFEQGNRLNYVLSNMSQLGRNLYVFWNAGVQGFNNFKKAAKDSPAKFTAMAGTYFTLGVLIAAAFSGDDDEDDYYNLPEYVRRNNICFKIGKGKYATLPLPIEIRAIYGLGELAYSYLSGREGLTHGEAVIKTIQQITQVMPIDMMADGGGAMALVPSAAKPVVEVMRNVDWTGRPIYKEKTPWNQNDPTWTLAFKSTSPELVEMSRLVNEWTNKNTADGLERPYNRGWADNRYLNNPAVWEHIAEGYLGGMATMFNQTKKTLMMPFNEDLREVRNVPIASRFIKDAGKEGRSYAARNEYYDAKNIMDSWKNEMSKAKKEVLDESLTDEQRLKAAKLRSSLEQQYMEAAERWKVLDRQRKALEEVYKNDQSEENRQALDDVMMQMATLVEAYRN